MSETAALDQRAETVPLGEIVPARSRHQGRRSAVALSGDRAVVGTPDGALLGFRRGDDEPLWRAEADGDPSIVAATAFGDGWLVGERSARGAIRYHGADGALRWRYDASEDVGDPQQDTRFMLPFLASLAVGPEHAYAAARRYERGSNGERTFESVVYAFEADGSVAWRFRTDASPISLDYRDGRLAVAYNRCPGSHQHGLVALDAADGSVRWDWDPGTEGQRRVGDVALLSEGVVLASHGDYRGYRLDQGGAERWRVDLATPTAIDGETVYAYPNHVHASESGAVFVTGNTYPEDGRETDVRHPDEHTAIAVTSDGDRRWSAGVGGFASGVGADGDTLAVPGAQHFRDRDADSHALHRFAVGGEHEVLPAEGVLTAAAVDGGSVAAVEEPVVYHDEGVEHGAHRLHWLA